MDKNEYQFGPGGMTSELWAVEDWVEVNYQGDGWRYGRVMAVHPRNQYYILFEDGMVRLENIYLHN